jgi:sec-independent protein translocase protein TatA
MHLGPLEIGLILVIILVVFGAGKLPEVGRAFGKSIHEFNKAKSGEEEDKKAGASAGSEEKKAN